MKKRKKNKKSPIDLNIICELKKNRRFSKTDSIEIDNKNKLLDEIFSYINSLDDNVNIIFISDIFLDDTRKLLLSDDVVFLYISNENEHLSINELVNIMRNKYKNLKIIRVTKDEIYV